MDIKALLADLRTLANYARSAGRDGLAHDTLETVEDLREMIAHQQREATNQRAGIDLETVSVIHALEIGLEETAKAHAYVEGARQEAIQRTNEAMARIADEKRSKVAAAFLVTITKQIETTPYGKMLAALAFGFPDREQAIMRLAESIANNLAVYAAIPDQCEVCGQISAGNTCCPPPKGFNDVDEDGVLFTEREDFANAEGTHDDADATSEEG